MHLVLIETSSNQRYIFATNKLRENIGASELTYRIGTEFVLQCVDEIKRIADEALRLYVEGDLSGDEIRERLLEKTLNPPLESKEENEVEVILATSGKAMLLVRDEDTGKEIIRKVTFRALRDAPGLTVHGVMSKKFEESDGIEKINQLIRQVHKQLEGIRYQLPHVERRFPRLPFVAPCASSGLSACHYDDNDKNDSAPRALVILAKRKAAEHGYTRIKQIAEQKDGQVRLCLNPADLESRFKEMGWLSVIHADGNGLGQIFHDLDKHMIEINPQATWRDYLDGYRLFSLSLDVCAIKAFRQALENLRPYLERSDEEESGQDRKNVPVVPIVLGGDDLTVLCDGKYAIKFARDFLLAFEDETKKNQFPEHASEGIISSIASAAFKNNYLGICAGVAIVKPHFPFHDAYRLAESLLRSAKNVKKELSSPIYSALDYHVHYDSSGVDLDLIRGKLRVDSGKTYLYVRPYVVTKKLPANAWAARRTWNKLAGRVAAMRARDEGNDNRRKLPNSMLHDLREGLFLGKQVANARMRLVRHRYQKDGFDDLLASATAKSESLFDISNDGDSEIYETGFMDALDIVELWQEEKEPMDQPARGEN